MKRGRLSILLLALLLPAIARGQTPQRCPTGQCPVPTQGWRPQQRSIVPAPVQTGNPAIVRVGDRYGSATSYGSGTIVSRRGGVAYIVTCWHTFRDSGGRGRALVWAAGRQYDAAMVCVDELWDVALLKIADPGIRPLPLSDATPARGQQIWLAGFGGGRYRHAAGQLAGFAAPDRAGSAFELMTVSTGARQGDSGGPMIGVRGRVVGIISATDGRSTYGCCLPRLRRILRAVLPPYPNRPGILLPKPRQVEVMPETPRTPPVAPVLPPVAPVLPAVAPANTAMLKRLADLEREVRTLREQVAACAGLEGPVGPSGPAGPRGPPGPPGSEGQRPVIDYQAIAKAVVAELPPVRMQIEHPDGKVFEQSKPLGEPIRIKLVPKAELKR